MLCQYNQRQNCTLYFNNLSYQIHLSSNKKKWFCDNSQVGHVEQNYFGEYLLEIYMQNQKENKTLTINIPPLHTYMISEADSASTDQLKLSLLSGDAQILGMALKKNYTLKFKMPCILLIFSWEGCELKAEWPEQKGGKSSEQWVDISIHNHLPQSPMIKYLNLHYDLTIARRLAQERMERGPRLAIVGAQSSGSNYSSKLLLNWTGKLNMQPVFADIDLDNSLFLDGSVGATCFEYKVCTNEDMFEKLDKICLIYGNRKIRTASYLKTVRLLAKHIHSRFMKQIVEVKWKGLKKEMSNFAAGVILQCPRVSEDKKNIKEMLPQLFAIFQITHVLIIDSPDLSNYISRNCPNIQKYVAPRIEGVQNLSKLPKKTKIIRFFGSDQTHEEKLGYQEVTLYQIIEEEYRLPYVRIVDIKNELVNKTGVAILEAEKKQGEDPEQIAKRILDSCVIMAGRIAKIAEDHVIYEFPLIENLGKITNKLWVSMIAEKANS